MQENNPSAGRRPRTAALRERFFAWGKIALPSQPVLCGRMFWPFVGTDRTFTRRSGFSRDGDLIDVNKSRLKPYKHPGQWPVFDAMACAYPCPYGPHKTHQAALRSIQ
jgi:hypothetical protein